MILRAATRGSALALWQTNHVGELLLGTDVDIMIVPVVVSTSGDRDKSTPIHEIGGKGVFVKEVQAAVLDGRADVAVHSAKDLPASTSEGLAIGAVPERADVRDALVGSTLERLAEGATVGTGSNRRRVQLSALRPDIKWVELRGNIDTRLGRVGELDAILMAAAALDRLERDAGIMERLDTELMVPQVAQGALAVEYATGNHEVEEVLQLIDHAASRRQITAERAFLAELGGDCSLPAGALAELQDERVTLTAILADEPTDRTAPEVHRAISSGVDPEAVGTEVARTLRAALDS